MTLILSTDEAKSKAANLSNVDSSLVGSDTVIVVTGISLSTGGRKRGGGLDIVGGNVRIVGTLQGTGILGADGSEDSIGSRDGRSLGGLVVGVSTRVEKDEGVLLFGNSSEVTLLDGGLQSSDTASVLETSTLDRSSRDGSVGRGHGRNTDKGGGGNSSHSSTTVHVQGSAGTLSNQQKRKGQMEM